MSSGGESSDVGKESGQPNKKRRIQRLQRACDVCRRKKIRCDWAVSQGNKCSYCRAHELDCNYTHGARETKQGISEAYVEDLESCIRKVTAYLNRFHPEVDLTREFGLPHDLDGWMKTRKKPTDATSTFSFKDRSLSSPNAPRPVKDEPLSSDEESFKLSHVQERMQDLHIVDRFLGQASVLGKSSSVTLIKSALDMKRGTHSNASLLTMGSRRGEHWGPKPWEIDTAQTFDPRLHDFPPSDLLYSLIELWFNTRHHLFPLLHKPTFMKHLADGLHYREGAFAGVVLTVCACASRFSSDPRVVYPGTDSWPSAGWQWFIRARTYHQVSLSSPTLHDVQMYCMGCAYLEGTSMPQACWTLCGTAIRLAQDVGAHRKKAYQAKPTVEDELWKRAFWCLVFTDRWLSAQLGRTCAIQDEEFDLDYPTDCDDEYWMPSDSSEAFTQPPGKPSSVSWFISMLKLNKILGLAMRTIFAMTNKNNLLLDLIGPNWEQRVVSAIDSALNQWVDSIPEHLKWKPDREEVLLMVQSADLYLSYYELQISIHRCFLPTPQKPSPVTFPSLAICTNAARSCCHVLECVRAKLPKLWREHAFGMPAFNAALVLLLNIFGAKRNGIAIDTAKDMACVHICMQAIKDAEMRWPLAGRLWDILHNLSSVGDLSLPNEPSPPHSNTHTSSSPISALSQHHSPTIGQPPSMPTGSPHGPPVVAPMNPYLSADAAQPILFTNSNDLGRLPVHLMSKPLPASLEMTSQAYTTSYHGDAPDLFGVSSILDPSALTTLGGPLDMNIPWPAAVAGGPSPDAWSQSDLAQLLGSLGNVQQGLVGSGGTWENMPFGFRLDGWDSYLADLASDTQNHETLTGSQANQGPRSSETNSGLVQSTDPLFNIL